jgi:hypothetical protein
MDLQLPHFEKSPTKGILFEYILRNIYSKGIKRNSNQKPWNWSNSYQTTAKTQKTWQITSNS